MMNQINIKWEEDTPRKLEKSNESISCLSKIPS